MAGINPAGIEAQLYAAPGGLYLCQVNASVSCAACCGLYNMADTGKAHMTALLAERSRLFAETPRSIGGIDGFARRLLSTESQNRPFSDFHHCPFIGLIGEDMDRVGCLLHPLGAGNNGIDYRGMSYYGTMACRTYFCPTHQHLPAVYKQLLRLVVNDWYLYGLVVTEIKLLEALFGLVENSLAKPLDAKALLGKPQARKKLAEMLALKCNWPYRTAETATLCHNFFADDHTPRPAVDYHASAGAPSRYDAVFVELGAAFCNSDQLQQAERLVERHIQAVVSALQTG